MEKMRRYSFKIEGKFTLLNLPMERLAQYMAELSRMLGSSEKVHFIELVEGSVALVHAAEIDAIPEIQSRLVDLGAGTADVVSLNAYRTLNKLLSEDGSNAGFYDFAGGGKILDFPGDRAPDPIMFKGIAQSGRIDGTIISIGGTKEEVPVHVQSGEKIHRRCFAQRSLAKKLARHLFEGELRLHGQGRWARDDSGSWVLQKFSIKDFEELDGSSASQVFHDLRASSNAKWNDGENLWDEVVADRRGHLHQ